MKLTFGIYLNLGSRELAKEACDILKKEGWYVELDDSIITIPSCAWATLANVSLALQDLLDKDF